MRMMMKIKMDTEAGSRGLADGSLPKTLGEMMERLQPEAAYFGPDGGVRTAFIIFDLADPSDLPSVTEPAFSAGKATVEVFPVMNREDLQKGIQRMTGAG